MKSVSARGCVRGLAVGVLLAGCVVDLLYAGADGTGVMPTGAAVWPVAVVLLTGTACVLWPARRRPVWLGLEVRTTVPALVSLLFTGGVRVAGVRATFGPAEIMILLSLLFVAVRRCPPRRAVACAALDACALLLLPLRAYQNLTGAASGFEMAGLVLAAFTAGTAAYLRSLDYRRTVAVTETRRSERLAIAADLHDFVAHHVTGILVQAQMAQMMAATRPQDLPPVLTGIEQAATEALASMRRTVGVLRDTGPEATDRRPVGDLAGIKELTERFTATGPRAVLHRDVTLPGNLPHEIQSAAFRVVQEALTNVRRHAADATEVVVTLAWDGQRLEVTVTDDGRGGAQIPAAAQGGGFGLVGLKERVTALGGDLCTGPRRENGWQVRAVLPATPAT